ncbi:MAG: flavin reductase family protein [Candidatus Zixiibacteriota bacterium]
MITEKSITKGLRQLEYGVYVVSMGKGQEGNAFTASWLMQISSLPPMVAMAVHNKHQSSRLLKQHGAFVVNMIAAGNVEVAKTYYGPAESGYQKLHSASLTSSPVTGSPVLNGVVGFLDCKVVNTVPAGNHTVYVAEVVAAEVADEKPLLSTSNSKLHYLG